MNTVRLSTVSFLDVKVPIEKDGSLATSLFSKPSATFHYLSAKSNHPPHTIKALPKSQFIRICRICSSTTDYWKHATEFIKFFTKRRYKPANLNKLATEVSRMDRNDILCYNTRNKSERIPFVITWHQQLQGIPKVIHSAYKAVIKKYPGFQNTFKELPAYRRPKNLMSHLAKSRYTSKVTPENIPKRESETFIRNCFNKSETITNTLPKRSAKIQGGSPTDRSVIYAATCKKCQLMYIGQTGDAINCRFNRHCSDILCYPNQCELPKHFRYGDCSIQTDLSVSILEKVKGSEYLQNTKKINGLYVWILFILMV